MTDNHSENHLLIRIESMVKRTEQMEGLLRQAYNYVRAHWERSAFGTGESAKILMNEIEKVIHIERKK